jgi:hypothetical protein
LIATPFIPPNSTKNHRDVIGNVALTIFLYTIGAPLNVRPPSIVHSPEMLLLAASVAAMLANILTMCVNLHLGKGAEFGKISHAFVIPKILLVPLIGLVWYQITTDFNWKVVGFMLGAWLGDVGLLCDIHSSTIETIFAFTGAFFFSVSHFFMISYFSFDISSVPWWAYTFTIPAILLLAKVVPRIRCKGVASIFAVYYCIVIELAYVAAICRLSIYPLWHPSYLLCLIGYLCFLFSDSILISRELGFDTRPRRLEVMGSYSLAQVFLIMGTACAYL